MARDGLNCNLADVSKWCHSEVLVVGRPQTLVDLGREDAPVAEILERKMKSTKPTFPIWLNIPLSKSSAFFKPLSICETLAVGMAIITP